MIFFQQLRGELLKLYSRKRTYMGYAAFLVMEAVILLVYKRQGSQHFMRNLIERNGFGFETYYSSLTVTYWIMAFSMFLLGAIYFALVAGDIVAKESEDGNLRLVLARPVSRLRLLGVKYAAVSIYTTTFVAFVGITGYLMAVAALGSGGGLFVWSPEMKVFAVFPTWSQGFGRLVAAGFGIGVSMVTLSSLAFLFSCFPIKPAAATIMALSILFVDMVMRKFPFFEPYETWFVTWRMSVWIYLLENHISWPKIAESYAFLLGLDATLFVIAWLAFQIRDFKT